MIDLAAKLEALAARRHMQVVVLLLLVVYGAYRVMRGMGDFEVYQRAAQRAVAGESMYRLDDPHRYLYAPVVTVLFLPLAHLPTYAGRALWYAANVGMLVGILRSTAVLLFGSVRAPPGFYVLVLALSIRFVDNNVGHGQINILLLWLVLGAYVLAVRGRFSVAGLALAGAMATKLVPAILLLQLLLRRQWQFLFATGAGFAVLMAAPVLWWGEDYLHVLRDWATVVIDQAGHYDITNKINQSISAFAHRLLRPHPDGMPLIELPEVAVSVTTVAIHAAFVVPLVWLSLRLRSARVTEPQGPKGDELALYLLYSTVLSPYSWKYYFVNLSFPLAGLVQRLWGEKRSSLFESGLSAVFLLNLLPARDLVGKRLTTAFQLSSFHFLAAALLFALLAREAFRVLGTETEKGDDRAADS